MQFLRLNIISILYGLFLFIAVEFVLNVKSVGNLTGEELAIVNIMAIITFLIVVLGVGMTMIFLTKRWFGKQRMKFLTSILWIPYFVLFVVLFTQAFPGIAGSIPTNSTVLWVLAGTLGIYPFYILLINFLSAR